MAENPSLTGVVGVIVLVGCYFMPTIIALLRGKRRASSVAVVNFFLGWTVIAWLLALVWASSGKTTSDQKREEQRHSEMMPMRGARR